MKWPRHKTFRPLEEYYDDSAVVAIQFVEGRNDNPYLGAEGGDGENKGGLVNEEDEEEEAGTYQHDDRRF